MPQDLPEPRYEIWLRLDGDGGELQGGWYRLAFIEGGEEGQDLLALAKERIPGSRPMRLIRWTAEIAGEVE